MYLYIIVQLVFITIVDCISQYPILIIVSYDAFRYNYFEREANPVLKKLQKKGTHTTSLTNVFPTKTFPNHHSIATGLYPESHGVVGNQFYDPTLNKIINMSYEMFHYNEEITPIWILNEKAAMDRHSGVMMWPGSSYAYNKINPTYSMAWNASISWFQRIDTVISWILDNSKPANLIMLYFEEPDTHGHAFGPESSEVLNMLKNLDNVTNYLHGSLSNHGLTDRVNVIHLSDHGMSSVYYRDIIDLTEFLEPNTYQIAETSPCLHIIPKKGYEDKVYDGVKKVQQKNKNFNVYKKNELPPKWKLKNNPRIPPILAVAEPGFAFQDLKQSAKYYEKEFGVQITNTSKYGVHGYDYEDKDMHPFFIAVGPNIKVNHKVPPFSTLDLFSLFCSILDVNTVPNNGTFANIRDILQSTKSTIVSPIIVAVGGCVISLSLIGLVLAVIVLLKRKKHRTEYPTTFGRILEEQDENMVVEAQGLLEQEEI